MFAVVFYMQVLQRVVATSCRSAFLCKSHQVDMISEGRLRGVFKSNGKIEASTGKNRL